MLLIFIFISIRKKHITFHYCYETRYFYICSISKRKTGNFLQWNAELRHIQTKIISFFVLCFFVKTSYIWLILQFHSFVLCESIFQNLITQANFIQKFHGLSKEIMELSFVSLQNFLYCSFHFYMLRTFYFLCSSIEFNFLMTLIPCCLAFA